MSDFRRSYVPVRIGTDRPCCYNDSLMRHLLMHISSFLNISSFFPFFLQNDRSANLLTSIRVTSIEALKSCCEFLAFCRSAVVVSTFDTLSRNVGRHPVMRRYSPEEWRPKLTLFIILLLKFELGNFTDQSLTVQCKELVLLRYLHKRFSTLTTNVMLSAWSVRGISTVNPAF